MAAERAKIASETDLIVEIDLLVAEKITWYWMNAW